MVTRVSPLSSDLPFISVKSACSVVRKFVAWHSVQPRMDILHAGIFFSAFPGNSDEIFLRTITVASSKRDNIKRRASARCIQGDWLCPVVPLQRYFGFIYKQRQPLLLCIAHHGCRRAKMARISTYPIARVPHQKQFEIGSIKLAQFEGRPPSY